MRREYQQGSADPCRLHPRGCIGKSPRGRFSPCKQVCNDSFTRNRFVAGLFLLLRRQTFTFLFERTSVSCVLIRKIKPSLLFPLVLSISPRHTFKATKITQNNLFLLRKSLIRIIFFTVLYIHPVRLRSKSGRFVTTYLIFCVGSTWSVCRAKVVSPGVRASICKPTPSPTRSKSLFCPATA